MFQKYVIAPPHSLTVPPEIITPHSLTVPPEIVTPHSLTVPPEIVTPHSLIMDEKCDDKDSTEDMQKFEEIREKVLDAINRIDLIDDKTKVQKLFRAFDYFILLKKEIAQKYNAQIVTNAWLKCYEILSHFKISQHFASFLSKEKNNNLPKVITSHSLSVPPKVITSHSLSVPPKVITSHSLSVPPKVVTSHSLSVPRKLVTAFFNAELPGAFISATNHYVKTMLPDYKFEWRASSLYGTETNLGDSYGMYKNYRDFWLMSGEMNNEFVKSNKITNSSDTRPNEGVKRLSEQRSGNDGATGDRAALLRPRAVSRVESLDSDSKSSKINHNGDLTNPENLLKIQQQIYDVFSEGVMLYTSDGGVGIEEEYDKQEELNAKLNLGQVICGLMTLAEDGVSITKQYMFTYSHTISLICITAYLFKDLYIVKPMTSRPVNSEVYIVGIGFRSNRMTKSLQSYLLNSLKNFDFNKSLLPMECMDETTLSTIYKAAKIIHGEDQINSVNKVIDSYFNKSMDEIYNMTKPYYKKAISKYFEDCPLKKLSDSDKLNIK